MWNGDLASQFVSCRSTGNAVQLWNGCMTGVLYRSTARIHIVPNPASFTLSAQDRQHPSFCPDSGVDDREMAPSHCMCMQSWSMIFNLFFFARRASLQRPTLVCFEPSFSTPVRVIDVLLVCVCAGVTDVCRRVWLRGQQRTPTYGGLENGNVWKLRIRRVL